MWRHTIFQAIVPLEHRDVPQAIHYAWFFHPATEVSNRISLKPNLEIAGIIQPDIPVLAFLPEAVAQCLESQGYAEWRSLSHRASDRFSKEMLLENHIVGVPPHVYFIFNQFGDFKITYFLQWNVVISADCGRGKRERVRAERLWTQPLIESKEWKYISHEDEEDQDKNGSQKKNTWISEGMFGSFPVLKGFEE